MKKILFVCTGNICRSSTAEAMMRHKLNKMEQGNHYIVEFAGTHDFHIGSPSDHRAIKAASKRNIDMSDIRARQIKPSDFEEFDYLIAMDQGHRRILKNIAPQEYHHKISLFLDHSDQEIRDVPDPYYGDLKGFEEVLDILEKGMSGLISYIQK